MEAKRKKNDAERKERRNYPSRNSNKEHEERDSKGTRWTTRGEETKRERVGEEHQDNHTQVCSATARKKKKQRCEMMTREM